MAKIVGKKSAKNIFPVAVLIAMVYFAAYNFPPDHRNRLTDTQEGINHAFRQKREPTSEEREVGMKAFKNWKSLNQREKNILASDIVLGKVLIGLTQKEIVEFMGNPDAFGAVPDIDPRIVQTGYNVADGESQCDLMIMLKNNGKTSDVYLDVNY